MHSNAGGAFAVAACLAACVSTPGAGKKPEIVVSTQTFDAAGKPTSGSALGDDLWGLSGAIPQDRQGAETRPSTQPASEQERERRRQDEALARTQFGSSIVIGADGRITKQYFLGGETSSMFLSLLAEPKAPSTQPPAVAPLPPPGTRCGGKDGAGSLLGRMLGEHEVELFFLQDFERMDPANIAAKVTGEVTRSPGAPNAASNSLLLVTAKPTALMAFEAALNLFYGSIPQIEIEVKVAEFNISDSIHFGVEQTGANTPLLSRVGSDTLVRSITSSFPLNAPLIGGTNLDDQGTFVLGGVHDSWELSARLSALEVQNQVDIKSSPRMVVRNGGLASISTITQYPFPQAKIFIAAGQPVATNIEFKPVGITLNIRPVIAGTDVVILQIYADVSAVTGFAATDPVATPIISTRNAVTSVHVLNHQTTVIGGLLSSTSFDTESKVPILGDIPVLGMLFRSTSKSTSKTDLRFYITPHIFEGPRGFKAEDRVPNGG